MSDGSPDVMTDVHPRRAPASANVRAWRAAAALIGAFLMCVVTQAGLVHDVAAVQVPILVGVVAGLTAARREDAALSAAAALGVAALVSPTSAAVAAAWSTLPMVALGAIGSGAVAWIARSLVQRRSRAALALFGLAMVLIIGNMWVTAFALGTASPGRGSGALLRTLDTPQPAPAMYNDEQFYHRVLQLMRAGTPYYAAYRQAFHDNGRWGADPPSPIAVRLPTTFWLWEVLPGGGVGMVVNMLVFATVAVCAGAWLAAARARLPLALVAAAALASYYLYHATMTSILHTESYAAVIALCAVTAYVTSFTSQRARAWCVAAVALAALACLTRELMLFVPVAGVVSTFAAGQDDGHFRRKAWLASLAVFAAGYAIHFAVAAGITTKSSSLSTWLQGGPETAWAALVYATYFLGETWWIAALLPAIAVAGAALAPSRPVRTFMLATVILPFVLFLLAGNGAFDENHVPVNYWGTIVQPILYAIVPWGLALIPSVARSGAPASRAVADEPVTGGD